MSNEAIKHPGYREALPAQFRADDPDKRCDEQDQKGNVKKDKFQLSYDAFDLRE